MTQLIWIGIMDHVLEGYHSCSEEWKVSDENQQINLKKIIPIIENLAPQLVDHRYIAWRCMDNPVLKMDKRYYECDIDIPGILAYNVINPFGKIYRMVDGSHRMAKMHLETDIRESMFYIITEDQFYSLLEPYDMV